MIKIRYNWLPFINLTIPVEQNKCIPKVHVKPKAKCKAYFIA